MATSEFIKTLNGYKIRDVESIHSLSADGKVITYTKGDGTTSTITTQDTTYDVANSSNAGLESAAHYTKVEGIEAGAEVNQNAFANVSDGTTTVAAAAKTDTFKVVGSGLVTVTANADTKTLTVATTANNYTHPTSGVTAGTYRSVTVNAAGHVTAGTNPTTISGYGITDAKIENGTASGDKKITLGTNNVQVLTPDSSLAAAKISGVIAIDNLPKGALERCVVVADDTARFALTTDSVQVGDTVKVTSTSKMYFVKDDANLDTEAGYEVYTAGSATTVPWSGVTGHGNFAGAAVEGGSANSAAKLDSNAGSATQPIYFANGVPVATTHALNATVPSDAKFTDTTYTAVVAGAADPGLMTGADKTKLDGIAAGANNYTLPTATSSVLGGIKVGSNLNISSGVVTAKTMTAATASAAGAAGYVPQPTAGANAKFLRGDAVWASLALNITDDGAGNITFGLITQP